MITKIRWKLPRKKNGDLASQNAAGAVLGIESGMTSRYCSTEHPTTPTLKTLRKIADRANADIVWLATGQGKPWTIDDLPEHLLQQTGRRKTRKAV